MLMLRASAAFAAALLATTSLAEAQTTLTIATVNNGDMIRMQKLTGDFSAKHPDIELDWVTLEENVAHPVPWTQVCLTRRA